MILRWPLCVEAVQRTLHFEVTVMVSMPTLKVALHRLWMAKKKELPGSLRFDSGKRLSEITLNKAARKAVHIKIKGISTNG